MEAIYEDLDNLGSGPGHKSISSVAPHQELKPALPSRNKPLKKMISSDLHPAFSHHGKTSTIGGVPRGPKEEQVYEDLDGLSDSDECSTTDNAAYVGNTSLSEAWVAIGEWEKKNSHKLGMNVRVVGII